MCEWVHSTKLTSRSLTESIFVCKVKQGEVSVFRRVECTESLELHKMINQTDIAELYAGMNCIFSGGLQSVRV